MLTTACCLVVRLGLGLGLVSGWLMVMHTFAYFYYFPLSLYGIVLSNLAALSRQR